MKSVIYLSIKALDLGHVKFQRIRLKNIIRFIERNGNVPRLERIETSYAYTILGSEAGIMGLNADRVKHLAERAEYRVDNLANLLGYSRRTLSRIWSSSFRGTPKSWFQELRLSKALELSEKGVARKTIALELNFHHYATFYRAFRRRYPSNIRYRHAKP